MSYKLSSTKSIVIGALSVAINIVLGTVVGFLHIPLLFLDTVGTIFAGVTIGPWKAAMVGAVTNLLLSFIKNPKDMPFFIVNAMVGFVVGWIARKRNFTFSIAVITGLILSVLAPLIGTPIAVYVYGGITGDFNDVFFSLLKNSGQKIFSAAFWPRIASNIVDKVVSCVLVSQVFQRIKRYL